jgi:DNA-binding transcriptional regulator GbsR (MarR family)
MNISPTQIILTIFASLLSGLVTAFYNQRKNKKLEIKRAEEKAQDNLKIELKDLQIKLYKLEKWKNKYYEALQELISVRSELEDTLIKLTHLKIHAENIEN